MRRVMLSAGLAALVVGSTASAQELVYFPAPPVAGAPTRTAYFPMGTPVVLSTRTQVSSKLNKPGDRIYFEVVEPLMHDGQVVVPVGATAVGEVADMQRNGLFGVKGKLAIRLLYMLTPSGPVRISGRAGNEGASGTAASVATIVFVSWLGFLIHGTSAKMGSGTVVNAYLADDLKFTIQRPQVRDTAQVEPDGVVGGVPVRERTLPARFDPSVFGKAPQAVSGR